MTDVKIVTVVLKTTAFSAVNIEVVVDKVRLLGYFWFAGHGLELPFGPSEVWYAFRGPEPYQGFSRCFSSYRQFTFILVKGA